MGLATGQKISVTSRSGRVLLALILALSVGLLVLLAFRGKPAAAVTTLPPGFQDQLVGTAGSPTALAAMPDGKVLVAGKPGKLRIYQDGASVMTTALDLSGRICSNSERGLVGVTVDPNFATNKYIYLFYTHNKHGACPTFDPADPTNPVNRVSRFVMSGDKVDETSEKILIDNIPSIGRHNAGDMYFGKDGYLYVAVGDGGCDYAGDSGCQGQNDATRDTHVLLGKILRVTRDGGIPSTNPYQGTGSARCNVAGKTDPGKQCQETFASGLRNPFRFAFDPDASGTRFLIGDVGGDAWESVDEGRAGVDYGWNFCEGSHDNPFRPGSVDCTAAPYTPPVHEYSHDATGGCASITGQAFVPNNAAWPASHNDSYLFGDYVCNKIFELKPKSGGGFTMSEFATGLGPGGPIAMTFARHGSGQSLYYTTYDNGGEIRRIAYTATNNGAPNAVVSATPTSGDLPLNVSFDGSASSDPDPGDTLTYLWNFGDGSPVVETTTPTTNHTYTVANGYTATLTVRDNKGAEDTATVRIDAGNASPEPTIQAPAASKLFKVGEQIVLQGSASDPEDGQLPDSALSWEVRQHHNDSHWHPVLDATPGNNVPLTAPAPEDLLATGPGNYLEIRLTATDSSGKTTMVTQELQPNRVNATFETQPSGLSLQVNGETFAAPRTFVSWEGYKLNVSAPPTQTLAGTAYAFASWSDGGAQTHEVLTGTQPSTYTATYRAESCTITGTSGDDVLQGTPGDDVICGGLGRDTIKGLGGNDVLKGEDGGDALFGGEGNDALDGGAGFGDTADFAESPAAVTASLVSNTATGEGSDTLANVENLAGSNFNDTLTGSDGNSFLSGKGGADSINGSGGADRLYGDGGSDTVRGGAGNDSVIGSTGSDMLFGDDGDDVVNSRDSTSGNDSLDGGAHVAGDTSTTDATEKSIVGFP